MFGSTYPEREVGMEARLDFTRFATSACTSDVRKRFGDLYDVQGKQRKCLIDMLAPESNAVPRARCAISWAVDHLDRDSINEKIGLRLPDVPRGWPLLRAPSPPEDWSLPLPSLPEVTLLAFQNAHARDCRVKFDAAEHEYFIDGIKTIGSVTGLVHEYCEEFDALEMLKKMRSGRNWPRPRYLCKEPPAEVLREIEKISAASSLHSLLKSWKNFDAICNTARDLLLSCPSMKPILDRLSLNDEEIINEWREIADVASNQGTWMHWTFEAYINRVEGLATGPELAMFIAYLKSLTGLEAYRTEWVIFADEERIGGCIDFAARNSAGELVLFDWKRSSNLRGRYENPWRQMRYPLQGLPDCRGMHYRVQLNAYVWILEAYYGHVVSAMYVVCAHPDNGSSPFVDIVPRLPEIEQVMQMRRDRCRECMSMAACDRIREGDWMGNH